MKNLVLLANEFPYGNWEAYLETEVNYYHEFDKVFICSLQLRKEHKIKKEKLVYQTLVLLKWIMPLNGYISCILLEHYLILTYILRLLN